VDIEMLCQQALNILEEATNRRARNSPVGGTGTKSHLVLDKQGQATAVSLIF